MTARLVAVGRVVSPFSTMRVQFATSDELWEPEPTEPVDDPDLYRKQQVEDELAWGTDL